MRIQVISDLHMEFMDSVPGIGNAGADVLILGGDICVAEHLYRNPLSIIGIDGTVTDLTRVLNKDWHGWDAKRFREFFKRCSEGWANVIYVMGNHEHYNGRWERTEGVLRDELSRHPNIHLLEQNKLVIDDVVFLGASLWTDLNNHDPITMNAMRDMMNDYRSVSDFTHGDFRRLSPDTTVRKHDETVAWLRLMLAEDKRTTVVVTHHCPSQQSVHPKYAGQTIMNGAFSSNLDHIMMDHDHIKLWTFGHTHSGHRYRINDTLCVCNPHGYPNESNTGFDPNLVIDLDNMPIQDMFNKTLWVDQ